MAERIQDDPDTFAACELQRWNEVAVAAHEDDRVHDPADGQTRNVQADPQIDPLLFELRDDVIPQPSAVQDSADHRGAIHNGFALAV